MSFPRYPKYKDSGVEWLGEVPEHWEVASLKRGFRVTLGKMLQTEANGPDDELLPYLRAANIRWSGVDTSDVKRMWFSAADKKQLCLQEGDLLVSEGGDVGRSCIWAAEVPNCGFQNSVNRIRAIGGQSTRYLCYWMSTLKSKGYVDVLCNKSTIAHFTAEKVSSVPIPMPSIPEQAAIAIFLDRETTKIDALIAEQQRLIELLQEKRQAVISHAVTKGLNPDAPMKDSGIEWLGDVPGHWEVVPMKRMVEVKDGTHATPAYVAPADDTFPLITSKDFDENVICFDDAKHVSTDDYREIIRRSNTEQGDVLMSMIGGNIGKAVIVHSCRPFAIKNVALFKTTANQPLARFMLYYLRSGLLNVQIDLLSRGGAQGFLGLSDIRNLAFFAIPYDEFVVMVDELDTRVSRFNRLLEEAGLAISLLQERRSALISAAVTGQIDVRGLAGSEAA